MDDELKDKENNLNKETDNTDIISDITTSSTENLKMIVERLNKLYHSVEKPIEDAVHDAVHKVEEQLPNNLKNYSSLIIGTVSLLSLSFLTVGLYSLFKPKK